MSIDLNVYVPRLDKSLIPELVKRFSDFKMECEFHPDFAFDHDKDQGFLPIRMKVRASEIAQYADSDIMTGFEIFIEDFDYSAELAQIAAATGGAQQPGFLAKLFGKKTQVPPARTYIANKEIDDILKRCHDQVTLNMHANPTSQLRTGAYFAAILAELTNGIVLDPQEGEYFDSEAAIERFPAFIADYENSVAKEDWELPAFKSWEEPHW